MEWLAYIFEWVGRDDVPIRHGGEQTGRPIHRIDVTLDFGQELDGAETGARTLVVEPRVVLQRRVVLPLDETFVNQVEETAEYMAGDCQHIDNPGQNVDLVQDGIPAFKLFSEDVGEVDDLGEAQEHAS